MRAKAQGLKGAALPIAVVLVLILCPDAIVAQGQPLTEDELLSMVRSGLPLAYILDEVSNTCLDLRLTDDTLDRLSAAGLKSPDIERLRSSCNIAAPSRILVWVQNLRSIETTDMEQALRQRLGPDAIVSEREVEDRLQRLDIKRSQLREAVQIRQLAGAMNADLAVYVQPGETFSIRRSFGRLLLVSVPDQITTRRSAADSVATLVVSHLRNESSRD